MTNQGLSIGEVARRTGVSAHTLRYYERVGLLPEVERAESSHRRYGERHVRWVRFLCRLRSAGMPIATMQRYVALAMAGEATLAQRHEMLAVHRREVVERIAQLEAHLEVLDRKLRRGCGPEHEVDGRTTEES